MRGTVMNRRQFMAGAAAAAGVVFDPRPAGAEGVRVGAEGASLHCFSKPLQWLGYDALAETLAQAGFRGIDLTVRPGGHVLPENAARDLPRAVEAARGQGLKVGMIVTAIQSADDPLAERVLKTAAQCGVRVYRMGYFRYGEGRGVGEEIDAFRGTFAALEKLNRACGITGCYQNHRGMGERNFGAVLWDLHAALKGLDPRWIGCQFDVLHASAEISDSWVTGMRLMAPYIRSTCLKDYAWTGESKRQLLCVPAGEGAVVWKRYFELVKELRVGGPVSVHCEWELFTKGEQALPEEGRRAVALRKMRREREFFAAQFAKYGLTAE